MFFVEAIVQLFSFPFSGIGGWLAGDSGRLYPLLVCDSLQAMVPLLKWFESKDAYDDTFYLTLHSALQTRESCQLPNSILKSGDVTFGATLPRTIAF